MKKYLLLTAIAATIVPTAVLAQHQDRAQHGNRTEMRHEQRTVRQDRRTVRADRQTAHADNRAVRADRTLARQTRNNVGHYSTRTRTRAAYVAPVRNWSYRPVSVGYRLQPAFYSQNYYITDYGAYHLRAPGRFLRWIRYGNDLLLVNIRTGRVMDVVHYRYW